MIKYFLIYLICLIAINRIGANRIRLCVSTSNFDKLQPQCVFCPSRQLSKTENKFIQDLDLIFILNQFLGKTLEACTGSSEVNSNITIQQAKCLINLCNRNQLPTSSLHHQQNQFIETVNVKKNQINKQNYQTTNTIPSYSIVNPMINGDNSELTGQQVDRENDGLNDSNNLNNNLNSQTTDLMINEQNNALINKPSNNLFIQDSNTNSNFNLMPSTPMPNNNKFIIKRKPFKPFRLFWPFFKTY